MGLYNAFNPDGGTGGRFIDWSVELSLVDEEALKELTASASQDAQVSRVGQTLDTMTDVLPFGTFEPGGWPLDSSRVIPPRVTELPEAQIGWISSALSGEDGLFSVPPVYTAGTVNPYSHIAVNLDWGDVPAVDFAVRWYNGAGLLREETVTGNADRLSEVNTAVADVTSITVTVIRTAPYHRARLSEFIPGATIRYHRGNAGDLRVTEVIDPLSERASTKRLFS